MAARTMQEAIDTCRAMAIDGQTLTLYCKKNASSSWVKLATYAPAPPIRYVNKYSGRTEMLPRCDVQVVPLRRYHF